VSVFTPVLHCFDTVSWVTGHPTHKTCATFLPGFSYRIW